MAPKRTYTRYNMSIAKPDALDPSDPDNIYHEVNKRRKPTPPSPVNTMHHSHVISSGGRPKGITRSNTTSRSLNSNSKSFSGPTSVPSDDTDPFDSVLKMAQEKKVSQLPRSTCLYGGGRNAINSISTLLKNGRREQKRREAPIQVSDDSSSDGGVQLPTNDQSEVIDLGSDDMDASMDSSSPVEVAMRGESDLTAAEASARVFEGREYTAAQTAPPQRTFYGARIQANSAQSQVWSANQTSSPLLRLPANVRRSIFEYVLGGNSIEFGFVTYLVHKTADRKNVHIPYFQYTSNVYPSGPLGIQCNPFHGAPLPLHSDPDTMGMTLLNGVCRQLYCETYTVPYALNDFYFNSGNALFNFLVKEDRLQPQQRQAIESIVVLHTLPSQSVLDKLPNLQQVRLMAPNVHFELGYYKVVQDGNVAKCVKHVPKPLNATGKLAKSTILGGGYDKKFDPRKAYGGAYGRSGHGHSGSDEGYGYEGGKGKKKWTWWRQ
ncbi:hypothetical protein P171DRAFT_423404 [Karstenula rhodostoma CBS 690.94]|uniref:DUF7730 domain-containing protein n=1 Tax=Karstenula rhodostoma CBS 690.94 TaxID=1392251 RepID=A0A9P4P9B9_9PLEO|nr:hypothetical protein P171DRAFT_423404 [Karstenula rhodostoma CBS 690.94]